MKLKNMEISARKKKILLTLIKEYISTAIPIASKGLVEKYNLDISPATVRNELAELEELGYIRQPYTSAGRIPTEIAYKLYFNESKIRSLNSKEKEEMEEVFNPKEEESFRLTARKLAELSNNTVFWAFHKNNLYYTGISNLFQQPEFKNNNIVYDVSLVIDHMEEIISEIFNDLEIGKSVYIGSENPFGNFLSTVMLKYNTNNRSGVIGVLGPLRMKYKKNLALINYLQEKLIS